MTTETVNFNPSEILGMPSEPISLDISDLFIIIPAILLIFVLGYYFYLRKKNNTAIVSNSGINGKNVMRLHKLFRSFPILRKFYERTYNSVQQMYPSDTFAVTKMAVNTVTRGFLIFIGCILLIILISGFDILYMFTGILVAYVLMTNSIASKLQKQEKKLLSQFQEFLETLRYHYNETNKVDDAIDLCMEEMPYELSLHIQKIHDVVVSTDIDEAAELYTQEPNNKFFLMFCSICATVMKQGDRKLPKGVTVFLNNIKHLQEELNVELLKIKQKEAEFRGVVAISMLPVLALKPIELWARGSMPDIVPYYNGAYGTVVMFLIFFIAIYASNKIDTLKNGGSEENLKLWDRIASLPGVRLYLQKKMEINFSKTRKMEDDMKRAGVLLTVPTLYVKKYVFAIIFALLVNIVAIVSMESEKSAFLNDFDQVFTSGYAADKEYTQSLVDTASYMTKYHLKDKNISYEDLNTVIFDDVVYTSGITKVSDAKAIADIAVERIQSYRETYYQWYLVIISVLAALLGYRVPDFMLSAKKKAMEMDMEDEIIQFQSIALIMMHIKEATVEGTLEWMERFARCFKVSIMRCSLNIDSGEQQALEALKEEEPSPQFQKIVNSLMTVDRVGMEAAFDSVEVERDFLREKRKKDNEEVTHKKAGKAWGMVYLMLGAVIGLWLIGPMLLMSTSMQDQLTTMMTL